MTIRDGNWELVDHDFATARTVWRYFDGAATHFRTDYPVDRLIDENQAHFNASQGQCFGNGRRIASIPLNLFYEQLQEAQSQGDERYVRRWLNDGANRAFRTFKGTV